MDWIYTQESVDEIGCVHTVQGYDLNYAGVLFGNEIRYDAEKKEFIVDRSQYFDTNGRNTVESEEQLKEYILNIYRILLTRGIRGTYIYAADPGLREYLSRFAQIRSAADGE